MRCAGVREVARGTVIVALCALLLVTYPAAAALRPPVAGRNGAVSAGHPLTTAAAFEILLKGGNAFDAGVAALLVGGVVEQDLYSLGGEALVLVYPRKAGRVISVVGQGWAPKYATVDWFLDRGRDLNGEGLDPSVVPGALDAALRVLARWGTMSFEEVSARAIEYAEKGFQLRPRTASSIENNLEFIRQWPDNVRTWLKPGGVLYKPGELIRLPDLAATLKKMVEAERANRHLGRERAIEAARQRFYAGDIAREMVAFLNSKGYPYEISDFAEFYSRIEEPAMTTYKGYKVYKHGFNSQGPVLLQTLNILENFDLQALKHNSADYIHVVIEAMKLAYADRDTYYADPEFVKVPAKGLLSKDYARERASTIRLDRANPAFVAGDPLKYDPEVKDWPFWKANIVPSGQQSADPQAARNGAVRDTTHIAIIDKDGNIFDSTPSGGWIGGAVILGRTGIGMSVRGEQFWLDKTRAQQIRPRSRPRYTLTPSIVLRGNQPFMAIGTPGGDNQDQTILQMFLNIVEFWDAWYPNLHEALEWPRFQTLHFYNSFWPHASGFNRMNVEAGIPDEVFNALRARGHAISRVRQWGVSGCATIALIDPRTGQRITGGEPRRDCYGIAY
ncbi:MAG: gamma-glutamyltransferase family protein [Armatimonadota bacterium]|nr:gamma-glutamyltransferase family protein [Armatimonadota bacterium]